MDELCEVLAVNIGDAVLERDAMPSAEMVITTCGSLVEHDKKSNLVTFSHETVRPFLEENEVGNLLSHSDLAKTCLTYLGFPEFEQSIEDYVEYEEMVGTFRFSEYAANAWEHARLAKREAALDKTILAILSSDVRRNSISRLRHGRWLLNPGQSIMHILIENQLSFIFMHPLAHDART